MYKTFTDMIFRKVGVAMFNYDTALIMVDVHGDYARQNPKTTRAIHAFADSVRHKMPIINVQMDAHWPQTPSPAGTQVGLNDDIYNRVTAGDIVFGKIGQDAFETGYLAAFFDYVLGIKNVEICGFYANQCVRDTYDGALRAGLSPRIITDLSADFGDRHYRPSPKGRTLRTTVHSLNVGPTRTAPQSVARQNYSHLIA